MSLNKFFKITGGGQKPDETDLEVEKPSQVMDKLVEKYKEARYFKESMVCPNIRVDTHEKRHV